MKALTISQPYADLIASGAKWVENRRWETLYRGPLAIHAGKGTQYLTTNELKRYQTGAIVAVAELVCCLHIPTLREHRGAPLGVRNRLSSEEVAAVLAHEHTEGPFAWVLRDIRRLAIPVTYRGAQGLFDIPDEIVGA